LYAGIKLLTLQTVHYHVIDHASGIDMLDDFQYTTAEKFTSLSSGVTKTQSVNNARDVQQTLSAQITNLKPGETRVVAFAFLAGDNLADMQASAIVAQNKFTKLKTSPVPLVANVEVCKNDYATISPKNGRNFNLYNSIPLTTPVAKGSTFNLGRVSRDSTYYISSTDSLYESVAVAIEVKAITHTTAFDVAHDTIGLYEGEVLQLTDKSPEATKWTWTFGDNSSSTLQSPSHAYTTPGKYTVKLISENRLGCRDSLIREVLVVNGKKSLKPVVSDKTLCNGEKLLLAPANGTNFRLYKQLPLTVPLASGTIFDLGNVDKDTIFYISCTDFLLESEPVAVHIKVSRHTSIFEISRDTLDLGLQQPLQIHDTSAGAIHWQWNFGDGSTSTEQHPTHLYALPGEYTVTLTSKNSSGCESTSSQKVVAIQTTGFEDDIHKLITIFPNPTSGRFTIGFVKGYIPAMYDIRITNVLGQILYQSSAHGSETVIDISSFTKGQYLISIQTGNQVAIKKLIVY
jgi:PKD repeat protein